MNKDKFDILSVKMLTKLNEDAASLTESDAEQLDRNIQPLKMQRMSVQQNIDKTNATLGTHSAQSFINRGKRDELNSKISKLEGLKKMSKEAEEKDGLIEEDDELIMALAAQFDGDLLDEDQQMPQPVSVSAQKAMLNNAGLQAKNEMKKAQAAAVEAKQEAAIAKENAEAKAKAAKEAANRQQQQSVDATIADNQQSINAAESKKQAAQAKLDKISDAKDRLNIATSLTEDADISIDEGLISAIKNAVNDHKVKSLTKKTDSIRKQKGKLQIKIEDLNKKIRGTKNEHKQAKYQAKIDDLAGKIAELDDKFRDLDTKLANTGESLSDEPGTTYIRESLDAIERQMTLLEAEIDSAYETMNADEKENDKPSFDDAAKPAEPESDKKEGESVDSCMADNYETIKDSDDAFIKKLKTAINDELHAESPDMLKIQKLKLRLVKAKKQAE